MAKLTTQQKELVKAAMAEGGPIGMPGAAAFNADQRAQHPAIPISDPRRITTPIDAPPSTSRWNTILRGFGEGIGNAVDIPAQFIVNNLAFTPTPMDTKTGPSIARDTGIPAATDRFGKDLEYFSRGIGESVPFAPVAYMGAGAAGVSPAMATGAELLTGGLQGVAQGELSDADHPGMGALAGLGIGMVTNPAGAVTGTNARKAAGELVDSVRLMTPEALALARANNLSRGAMVRGSSEIKRRVGDVPGMIDEIRTQTARAEQAGLPHGPSSRQIAEGMPYGIGGRFFTDAERNLTTTDVDYARDASVRFAENATELGNRWQRLSNVEPDFETFIQNYDEGSSLRDTVERDAWSAAMGGDQPQFNTADMVGRAKQIVGGAYFKRKDVPSAISMLADGKATTMDLPRFQELRSVLLGVVRDARKSGMSSDKHAASMAADMLDMMGQKIDDFAKNDPTGKSEAWANARRITLENKTLYDADSPVIRALDKGGQAKNLFEVMRRATGRKGNRTNPVEEAHRLVRIAEQTPGGMENLRSLAYEDLFAEGFNPNSVRQPEKILRRNEDMYRVIFGEHYDEALELVELSRLHTRGEAGTASEAYRTGSGVSPAAFLFGVAKSARNPVQAAVEGAMKLSGKELSRQLEWQRIVRTAIEQPQFLRVLLEMPTERTLPEWQANWRQLLAQSSARSAAKAAAKGQSTGESK